MPKIKSNKDWQDRNPDKVKQYSEKYLQDKKRVYLTLSVSTLEAIDEVKPKEQEYAAWIREFLEQWERQRVA